MPKPKPASQILGNGRGAYRKALLSMIMQKHAEPQALKNAIDFFSEQCVYCNLKQKGMLQPDHLWPEAIGGKHVTGNVVPSCPSCNSRRGSKDWEEFLRYDDIINDNLKNNDIDIKINKIKQFMHDYNQDNRPSLDESLAKEEIALREDFDLLLSALSHGVRAKLKNEQKKDVIFNDPEGLFDELISISKKYIKKTKKVS